LRWVGLEEQLESRPSTLSGGQQQRVAIARAVIARPELLLADEPTGNVDDEIAMRLLYLLEELNKIGTTVVIATHNEALVSKFDHPRLVLVDGEVVVSPAAAGAA
jgi:cell division transport system ATP-binding protein